MLTTSHFIARPHSFMTRRHARYWYSNSVCLSVHHTLVLCQNG